MFGRAAIRLGIRPHSSFNLVCVLITFVVNVIIAYRIYGQQNTVKIAIAPVFHPILARFYLVSR